MAGEEGEWGEIGAEQKSRSGAVAWEEERGEMGVDRGRMKSQTLAEAGEGWGEMRAKRDSPGLVFLVGTLGVAEGGGKSLRYVRGNQSSSPICRRIFTRTHVNL